MGRYANRTKRLEFPDLSEDDDLIYVVIRNPKTVPADVLMPDADVPEGPDGKPESKAAIAQSYEVMTKLILDWHVYDAMSDEDDLEPLPTPVTVEMLHRIPLEILTAVAEEIGQVVVAPR